MPDRSYNEAVAMAERFLSEQRSDADTKDALTKILIGARILERDAMLPFMCPKCKARYMAAKWKTD